MKITYYTYNAKTKRLTPAPNPANIGGHRVTNPSREQCATIGAYQLADPMPPAPTPPEGKVAVPDGYEPVDTPDGKEWRQTWRYEDAPPPAPKIYSTANAIEALMKAGVYAQCREWIEQQGLRDMMLATKEFSGDDENFQMILAGLQALLGWDDAKVAEILKQAEV